MKVPGKFSVEWRADGVPTEVKRFIIEYATREMEIYIQLHPEPGIKIEITSVGTDPVRQNEYDRATFNVIRIALVKLNLPDLLRYQAPTPEELLDD